MSLSPLKITLIAGLTALFSLPLWAAELVMVEQPGCVYCARWNAELSAIYPKTAEGKYAPLHRVQLTETKESGITFARGINFTPTFVLVENDTELARIEGYPGEDFFWGLLEMMLEAHTEYVAPGS